MIERHHDYILNIATIPAGGFIENYPLPIDTDAPFCCRGRGLHIAPPTESRTGPATRDQSNIQYLRFQFRNASGESLQQIPVYAPQDFAGAYGQAGHYRPVYPQQVYPPGGNIIVSIWNDGPQDITNLQVIFRGVKLFPDGSRPVRTYPPKCRVMDFTYQTGKGTQTDGPIVLPTTSSLYQ